MHNSELEQKRRGYNNERLTVIGGRYLTGGVSVVVGRASYGYYRILGVVMLG